MSVFINLILTWAERGTLLEYIEYIESIEQFSLGYDFVFILEQVP